jgi:hypothetical protein
VRFDFAVVCCVSHVVSCVHGVVRYFLELFMGVVDEAEGVYDISTYAIDA